MNVNLHTHTVRCGHADGSERDFIESAIRAGYTTLGFSDHAPHKFHRGYYSGFRMNAALLEDYVVFLRTLAEEYKNDIRILVGFEAEYYPDIFNDFLERIRPFDLDYLILGQHYLGNEENDVNCAFATDDPGVLRRYVDQSLTGLRTGVFTYMAHPDIMTYTGDPEIYRKEMSRLCIFGRDHRIPMEINLLGLSENRHYPKEDFIALCGELGTPMILGVDAHQPERFADTETPQRALELAERYGVEIVDMPCLRRPNEAAPIL